MHHRCVGCALPVGLRRVLGAAEQPEDARLDQHRLHERALRAQRCTLRPCGRLCEVRTESLRVALGPRSPRPPPMARRSWPLRPARTAAKAAPGAMRHARCSADEGSGAARRACRLSLPGRRSGALVAKGVVTGGKSGLRASGGKGIAKKIAREAFVTGWYGAAIHKLPGAAWSADADVGAARRNPVPLSRSSRCLAGRRPAVGTLSHSEPDGGSAQSNGEAAAARDLSGSKRRPGNPPVLMMPPSRGARRCKRGRGR